jgi:hypothetical protein
MRTKRGRAPNRVALSTGSRSEGLTEGMPCHHNLETYLTAYIEGASLDGDPKGPLFRTIGRGKGRLLTHTPCPRRTPIR